MNEARVISSINAHEAAKDLEKSRQPKILAVVDSISAQEVVNACIDLLHIGSLNAEIYLLYVDDIEPVPAAFESEKEFYEERRKKGRKVIDEVVGKLQNLGLNVKVLPIYLGIATEEILREDKCIKPDLLIMGVHRIPALKKFLAGDITEEIAEKTKTPVLIAK